MNRMEYTARVRHEQGWHWAEVVQLPGCFASGETIDELIDALRESIRLYLDVDQATPEPVVAKKLTIGPTA
jgi:predicted RNase H-like HicB family nuclease